MAVYRALLAAWGPQRWWPARSRFEVMVGAVLTQNTAWTNVEKALGNLRAARCLSPSTMVRMPAAKLASLIRPAGYFNVKARRLKHFVNWFMARHGGRLDRMKNHPTGQLREELLAVHGIGKETADSILLYALDRPVFVVDAYTRRFMVRHGWLDEKAAYDEVAELFTKNMPIRGVAQRVQTFNEFHALIVALAKRHCRAKPDCENCPLKGWLP